VDWVPVLVAVVALGAWIGLVRFVLPRFGIKGG
jgi:type II secretory pathway component PulF